MTNQTTDAKYSKYTSYIFQDHNPIGIDEKVYLVCDKNTCCMFFSQKAFRSDAFIENMGANVRINRAQWIVQQINIGVSIASACQAAKMEKKFVIPLDFS